MGQEVDQMNIAIFGANGRTGRILTRRALAAGHTVTAVTRHPAAFPLRDPRLTVFQGDATRSTSVDLAVAGQDAVLSVLGVPFGQKPITVYSLGVANIVSAMTRHGCRRLICVSSTAVDHRYDNGGGLLFERILKPLVASTIGRTTYADQKQMEALVRSSSLDWTIVRPSGLFETPEVTRYEVTNGYTTGKFTSRTDLAACMLQLLDDERSFQTAVAVATVEAQPKLLQMLMKEALPQRFNARTPELQGE
jgi:putative NADH-flavin reductase